MFLKPVKLKMNSHRVKHVHKSKSGGFNPTIGIVIEHLNHNFTETTRKSSKVKQGRLLFMTAIEEKPSH